VRILVQELAKMAAVLRGFSKRLVKVSVKV
jgi:hypothetical protein